MRLLLSLLTILTLQGCTKEMNSEVNTTTVTPNQFQAVWNRFASDPYRELPQVRVSFGKLFDWGKNIILRDAQRTLECRENILPPFEKLAHPNGVCLQGLWKIDTENPYSGYFKRNAKALIIARVSSAMSNTKQGEIRAFGVAGKLFPSTDPLEINSLPTANFFVIDDLGGTLAEQFADVALTNAPPLTTNSEVIKNLLYGLKVTSAFKDADKNPTERQLYEIAELGERGEVKTPRWMRLTTESGTTIKAEDFRDEFQPKEGREVVFNIAVANREVEGKKAWQEIGTITLKEAVASYSCDHRLHFHHPKWRE